MEVSRIRALRGPNLWTRETAIEAIVSLDPDEVRLDQLAGFEQSLRERLPALGRIEPSTSDGLASLAHALEAVALTLQTAAGCPVSFSRTVHAVRENVYQVVVQYSEEAVGRRAFEFAEALVRAARNGAAFDVTAVLAELRELDEDIRLGPSTGAIVQAAVARGIPGQAGVPRAPANPETPGWHTSPRPAAHLTGLLGRPRRPGSATALDSGWPREARARCSL
jgi:cyanophycin synthetase